MIYKYIFIPFFLSFFCTILYAQDDHKGLIGQDYDPRINSSFDMRVILGYPVKLEEIKYVISEAKKHISSGFLDPESVKYRDIFITGQSVCGELNA